jgi:MoxR-like ATPase
MITADDSAQLGHVRQRFRQVFDEIRRTFVGRSEVIDHLLVALLARGHVLLEGVPGVAKTTLMRTVATAIGCQQKRVQFTPDLLPSDITGTYVLSPRDGTFNLRPGPIFANIVLADEINRAPAKTQSALLEAMQEGQVTIEGERYELPTPFLVVATQNPVDLEGTYALPEAQVDRFLIRIRIGYPSVAEEVEMLRSHGQAAPQPRVVLQPGELAACQAIAARIHVEEDILHYAVQLATFTRRHNKVTLGASPRSSLALIQAAKAKALMDGRGFVTPDDVGFIAGPVLAHRLILENEDDRGRERDALIAEALARVPFQRGRTSS